MQEHASQAQSSTRDLLAKVSRYEGLIELAAAISAAIDIDSVGKVVAQRLKYVADAYTWRYFCVDEDPRIGSDGEPLTIIIDGFRGRATVTRATPEALSKLEADLWKEHKTRMLCGEPMSEALEQLPESFRRDDLEQISINALVENGKTRAIFLFGRRREPFTELDVKCLTMISGFFHRKVQMLWEEQKLRDLELAYLQQEVTLRQSEKLATLGRLSAGMAHELNNPAAVARQGAEQLKTSIARLERAQYILGGASLSDEQRRRVAELEAEANRRVKTASELDPISRSDLEEEVEKWLDEHDVVDPWEHAATLVSMGLCAAELGALTRCFDASQTPLVIEYFASKFTVYTLLEEIGHGTERIVTIVKALKGYSFMDQAPIQMIDVREGINDTLVMLSGKLKQGISVRLDLADDLPRIEAYGGELNQVWTNLVDNAIDAMNGKGSLEISAHKDDGGVIVEIADDGPGIPVDIQQKIFDPFFTTKAPGQGTGLGLNISHGIIVKKHGGLISVRSKPGATRFTVKLPLIAQGLSSNDETSEPASA